MNMFSLKNLVHYLFALLCLLLSGVSIAENDCSSKSPDFGESNWGEVDLLNKSGFSVLHQVMDPELEGYTGIFSNITIISLSICDQTGDLLKRISIPLNTPNRHILKITPDMFADLVVGSYKLNYRIGGTYEFGGNGNIYPFGYSHIGTVNLYEDSIPAISLSPANTSIKLGGAVDITVTAIDDGDKLVGNMRVTPPAGWSATRRSCATNTKTQHQCVYRLSHSKIASNLGSHDFSVKVTDKFNQTFEQTGTITVSEDNIKPKFILVSGKNITIAKNDQVLFKAEAEDDNIDSNKRIKTIQWCYSTNGRTNNCTKMVSGDVNSSGDCKVDSSGSSASCHYTKNFDNYGTYTVWAQVSDGQDIIQSDSYTVKVDQPPVVTLATTGDFRLGNNVTLRATASDNNLQSWALCYGPKGISKSTCQNKLTQCSGSSCTHTFTLAANTFNTGAHDFYVWANDGYNTVNQSNTYNIYGTYTLSSPHVNGANNFPGSTVTITGSYNKLGSDNNPVQQVELWVNDVRKQTITHANSSFSFNHTLANVSNEGFYFKLLDNHGVIITSAKVNYNINTNPPDGSPSVRYQTSSASNISQTGAFDIKLLPTENTEQYHWYEYQSTSCPQTPQQGVKIATTLAGQHQLTVNKSYAQNGHYCYCAQAQNLNGHSAIGTGSKCALVQVAIPDTAPGVTLFSANTPLSQNQPYTLRWHNSSPGARVFALAYKVGQPGSNHAWQSLPLTSGQARSFDVVNMTPGDVSYRIQACNEDNVCASGQMITINHQVPYLYQASYVAPSNGNVGEVVFEGLGLKGLTTVNVQLRNSAQSFTYPVYQADGDGTRRFRFIPDNALLTGLENGGLRLQASTLLGSAVIEFNHSGSRDRPVIDLIEASPTVSEQGVVYVSSGQSVHALNHQGNNLNGWPFTLPEETSDEARIHAAPTLDNDVNGNDVIYVGATNRYVYKLDHQSDILWQTRIRGEVHAKAQLLRQASTEPKQAFIKQLYVGTVANGGNDINGLYALDAETGAERFMYPLLTGVRQAPNIFTNGDLHITTEDEQLHIINRQHLGAYALRWEDIDSSLIRDSLATFPDWQIPEEANVPLHSFAGLFYGLLGRSPTRAELTFFAYAYWRGMSTNEITAAFLGSNKGMARFAPTQSDSLYIDSLFHYLFPSEPSKTSAGGLSKSQWRDELASGIPRSEVAYRLIQTNDYVAYSANVTALVTQIFYDHCQCNDHIDSDGDGVSDALELELGFNPLEPRDLVFGEPLLSKTTPVLGEFNLSWQAGSIPESPEGVTLPVFYRLVESVNEQPETTMLNEYHQNTHTLTKARGSYQYRVQACIEARICSHWSNEVLVNIDDSIAEAPVQPEAAPSAIASFTAPSSDDINTSASFAVTAGELRVNESGAATYNLPFMLPEGIAGVKPELGLSYSSQSGEGMAGVGWHLQGASSINRCGSSKLLDGLNKPVMFDETDNFCVDGQRLLLKSGTKGQAGSTYITEIDNQQVFTYLADDTFTVTGKDKSLRVYGATDNAKQKLTVDGHAVTNAWLLSYSQDNLRQSSNQIDYVYESTLDGHSQRLDEVRYSGNRVTFRYDDTGARIKSSGYIKGNRLSLRSYLTGVEIYSHQASLIRRYNFTLESNAIDQRQLTRIEECTTTTCKQAVTFDYRPVFSQDDYDISWRETISTPMGEYLRHAMVFDTNNDGLNELVTLTQTSDTNVKLCLGTTEHAEVSCRSLVIKDDVQQSIRLVPTDPDGDGFTNFLLNTDNDEDDGRWRQIDVLADGGLSYVRNPSLTTDTSMGINIKAMDVNGDGFNDIVETQTRGTDTLFVRLWSKESEAYLAPVRVRFNNGADIKSKISNGWQSVDINQDGLSDIVVWDKDEENLHFFTLDPAVQSIIDPICESRLLSNWCTSTHYQVNLYDTINVKGKHATPLDFNGDGLTDIVVYNKTSKRWQYHLNTGKRFVRGTDFAQNASLSASVAPMVTDIDGDGRLELIFHDKGDKKWYRYEWTHEEVINTFGSVVTQGFTRLPIALSDWTFYPPSDDPNDSDFDSKKVEYGSFSDIDNDGLLDFIYKGGRKNSASTSLKLYHGGSRVQYPGLLQSVTSGTGLTTTLDYDSMANAEVYSRAEGLPARMREQDEQFRVLNISGAGPLVSAMSNEVPVGNSLETLTVNYHYHGARAQFARGNLGFAAITTTMVKQGIRFDTTTTYSQVFPSIGMPLSTEKRANDTIISTATNRYFSERHDVGDGYHYYHVYQQESRDCQGNINTIDETTVTVNHYGCQQLLITQDSFANVTQSKTGYYDSTTPESFVVMENEAMDPPFSNTLKANSLKSLITDNTYGESDNEQRYGRLSASTVTHTRNTNSQALSETRRSAFTYNANGMLATEIIEPDGDCNTQLITEHSYDSVGNRIESHAHNDNACDTPISRTSSTTYDSEGRYPVSSTKNGIINTEILSRNALGQATRIRNVDGVVSQILFDGFGNKVASYSPSGAQATTLSQACDDARPYCYSMVVTRQNGIALSKAYIDSAGQVYAKASRDVFGTWHTTRQTYDKYGRVTASTSPGLRAITSQYDAFDRVTQSVDVNTGLTTTTTLTDRTETITLTGDIAENTQTKTTTYNALGEQYQVTDTENNTLTYTYGVFGKLTSVHSSADNQTLSAITYDKLGRKTQMDDKDRGQWHYQYNVFGQLTEQTDARGVVTRITYDDVGRKVQQRITAADENSSTNVASESQYWDYGTGDNKHRLLVQRALSERAQGAQSNTGEQDNWRRDFYYDHLGRQVASLTNLDGSTDCKANVSFNTVANDLRITNEQLADPITSRCVIQQSFFDEYGRPYQTFDDYRRNQDGSFIEARGVRLHYQYNQVIKQQEAREGTAGRYYHEVTAINENGLVTDYRKGNQAMTLGYDSAHRLASRSSNNIIQDDSYTYDSLGNLTSRQLANTEKQDFSYDSLNRVTHVNNTQYYAYQSNGNIAEKDGWTFSYNHSSKPHALTERVKDGPEGMITESYGYDANGNQIWGKKNNRNWRNITYTGRNKATRITVDNSTTTFHYDANNRRFKRTDNNSTIFYVGRLELTIKHGADGENSHSEATDGNSTPTTQHYIKRYIGDAMQTYYANGNAMLRWLYKDNLGSVIAITNDSGKLIKRFSYDVFGKQTEIIPSDTDRALYYELSLSSLLLAEISDNTKGYTGHEPVNTNGETALFT